MPPTSPTRSELRWFGCIVAAVFGVIGTVVWWKLDAGVGRGFWITGGVLGLGYYAIPPLRVPLYLSWMAIVTPFGRAVSLVVLATIYYVVITPIALVMRPFRRDPLTRRLEPEVPSYWSEHDPGGETARYFRQS